MQTNDDLQKYLKPNMVDNNSLIIFGFIVRLFFIQSLKTKNFNEKVLNEINYFKNIVQFLNGSVFKKKYNTINK